MPPRQASPLPKRRNIRKGTLSCWECKRRKTRCTFATSTSTVCDGCRSRQTKCLSQEYYDEPAHVLQVNSPSTDLVRPRRRSRLIDRLEEKRMSRADEKTVWSRNDHLEGGDVEEKGQVRFLVQTRHSILQLSPTTILATDT